MYYKKHMCIITIVDAFMAKWLHAIFVGVVFAEITILDAFMAKWLLVIFAGVYFLV